MITGEIKNRIDRIWDFFWTSGMANPMTVLEQLTYLFFMKMLDDKQLQEEANAAAWGNRLKDPIFKEGTWHNDETGNDIPYNDMRWSVFKNMSADNMFRMVSQNVFPFIKTIGEKDGSAYSRFMKDASFQINKARTLQNVVDGISALDMNNRDTMGDVYEYMLGKMAVSGTNGQFRTPRHIIAMMVNLMQPTLSDRICDPAMGSAGFLVEAAKYIVDNYRKDLLRPDNLKFFRTEMFNGFDTDQTMLRIGTMNMMLHTVDAPNIDQRDSLSNDNTDSNCYTLCLANPPFAGKLDKETIAKSLLQIANTTKTELLFMALFLRMLKLGGRCASIVPDGVLFGNSNAHKAIRKELVENQRLQAVISMPSGVFQPYSGVSTAILIFTKTNTPNSTDRVWFYEMHADGYTLDQKRTECAENDIPDVIARFQNLDAEADRSRKDQSFFVPVDEIRANDYDLTFNKYKEVERKVVEYDAPETILAHIDDLQQQIAEGLNNLKSIINH